MRPLGFRAISLGSAPSGHLILVPSIKVKGMIVGTSLLTFHDMLLGPISNMAPQLILDFGNDFSIEFCDEGIVGDPLQKGDVLLTDIAVLRASERIGPVYIDLNGGNRVTVADPKQVVKFGRWKLIRYYQQVPVEFFQHPSGTATP